MAISDFLAGAFNGAGETFRRIAQSLRPSETVSPPANLPGVPKWGSIPANQNRQIREALGLPDAYLGRISYDAGPSWTRFSSNPATDLTPDKIIAAQREASSGYPLRWEEMIEQVLSRDAHLAGIAQQRVDDVVKGSWRLVRATPDDTAACVRNFCDESLRSVDSLDDGLAWLLWGNAYCYNAAEIVWKLKRISFPGAKGERIGPVDALVPHRLEPVHAKHFRFDLRTDEPLLWLGSDNISLPFGKFVFYRGEGQHPITERRGFMWQCVWLSMIKSGGIAGWATFVERFGLPTPYIQYGDIAQYAEHRQLFQDLIEQLGQGFGAVVPQDVKIDNLQSPQGGRSSDPHSAIVSACDSMATIRVLGATLTTTIGNVGSFAASTTHADVKYAKEEADARRLWSALRSDMLAPIVEFNAENLAKALSDKGYDANPEMVLRRTPRGLHRVPREIDPLQRATVVDMAINKWGLKVGKESLYDEFNLPQSISDEDVAPGEATQVSQGGALIGSVDAANEGATPPQPVLPIDPNAPADPPSDPAPDRKMAGPADGDTKQPPPAEHPRVDITGTDVASIVTVNEARAGQGLPPMAGEDGDLTVSEYKAKHAAVVSTAASAAAGESPGGNK